MYSTVALLNNVRFCRGHRWRIQACFLLCHNTNSGHFRISPPRLMFIRGPVGLHRSSNCGSRSLNWTAKLELRSLSMGRNKFRTWKKFTLIITTAMKNSGISSWWKLWTSASKKSFMNQNLLISKKHIKSAKSRPIEFLWILLSIRKLTPCSLIQHRPMSARNCLKIHIWNRNSSSQEGPLCLWICRRRYMLRPKVNWAPKDTSSRLLE